ncbi:MAG: NAD(P)H-dependent oxidoreductase, partial [Clostridia bacterium]|nr:NAD(P)H-dependent oxidoreductase [Clostridia bacterium]
MNILVLNGSPAGKNSVTLQTALYIEKLFGEHSFDVIHVGQRIRSIEKDFSESEEKLKNADVILFCYPVYTFLVPSQLHRFIELIKEKDVDVSGKTATQISTSKHFYDSTAHRFIQDNCADLGLNYVRGLSADMDDILKEEGRKQAEDFFRFTLWSIENKCFEKPFLFGKKALLKAGVPENGAEKTDRSDVVIVADLGEDGGNLAAMINRFEKVFPGNTRTVDISEFPFSGGCLGCFNCASSGKCIYKDGFDSFLRERIQASDAIVYAFRIKDHSMGSRFKMYDDRQFCNGHRTVTMGKPVGYLIDGALSDETNVRALLESRAQVGGNFLAGLACSENAPEEEIDRMAKTLL